MPKSKKPKTVKVKDPARSDLIRRAVLHSLSAIVLIGLLAFGYYRLKKYVEGDLLVATRPPRVVIKNRPAWMSDALAAQIVHSLQPTSAHSAFDKKLLVDTVATLNRNPWIKQVHEVRRAYDKEPGDTLEIDCDFRAPIALVHWKDLFWIVDTEGVKLPEEFTVAQLPSIIRGADGKLNIRIVEGVAEAPVESGRQWAGADLAAALDLVKLLYGQPFAEEIVQVDVANYGGRIDPREAQISFITKYDTAIRWGRPLNAKDFFAEIPPSEKLDHLRQIWQQYHRVDAGVQWIDIRLDKITYPTARDASAHLDDARR